MSAEENKTVIRRLYEEVWNEHNPDALDEFAAPDLVNHDMLPEYKHGIDGFKHLIRWVHTASPDGRHDIEDMIAEGDKVAARVTVSGTHTGEIRGIPPTGRRFSVEHVHWYRLADGKIAEQWSVRDDLGQMQQLGVISMPEYSQGASPT